MKFYWRLIPVLLAATLACADEPRTSSPPVFSVYDLDRDGYLDRIEFERLRAECRARRAGLGRRPCPLEFNAVDVDDDGRIDEQEMLAALQRGRPRDGRGWHGGRSWQ